MNIEVQPPFFQNNYLNQVHMEKETAKILSNYTEQTIKKQIDSERLRNNLYYSEVQKSSQYKVS